MKKIENLADNVYLYFSEKPGNQHIASVYAIEKILTIIKNNNIQNILEVGLGIGSISYAVLLAEKKDIFSNKLNYEGTENNKFCLSQLPINLNTLLPSLKTYSSLEEVDKISHYDLIIIDGADESLKNVERLLKNKGIVIIEGLRKNQVSLIKSVFKKTFLYYQDISIKKNPDYGPRSKEKWSGGVQVVFVNPDFKQKCGWVKEKVKTTLKYRLRYLLKS